MRRIKLVLGVGAVMVAMLVAFAAPAMADHDDWEHPVIPILESALDVNLSNDDVYYWTGWGWGDDGVYYWT
ncbi:MAG: hypothetical protein LC672_06200, partial [Acidobacteria bacterium]|nr:hypothetical protein [Acidobacteriota bacterium]